MVERHYAGDVKAVERKMIERILGFGDLQVDQVMVPLVDVSAVDEEGAVKDVIERIEEDGHSRILVYRGEIHHIVGVAYARDILALPPETTGAIRKVENIVRPPYFVPESKPADDLLEEMQKTKQKLAVVVDEYGGCSGVVTIEDLVEEIVGEISDEYDVDEKRLYQWLGEGHYLVDARMEVEHVRDELSIPIPEGDFETLAGYLLDVFERIPKAGDRRLIDGWLFVIHAGSRIGAMVELNCETDFVGRTPEFKDLAHNIAMQVAAMSPLYLDAEDIPEDSEATPEEVCLMRQSFIKEPSKTIADLILEVRAKVGENIRVGRFARYGLGE